MRCINFVAHCSFHGLVSNSCEIFSRGIPCNIPLVKCKWLPRYPMVGHSKALQNYSIKFQSLWSLRQTRVRGGWAQKKHRTYRHVRRIVSEICSDKEIFPSKNHKALDRSFSILFSCWCGCGFRLADFVRRCSRSNSEPLLRDTPCRLTWRTYFSICVPFALGRCIACSTFHQNLE